MDVIFLGTSSGITNLNKFHSSLLFKTKSHNILIDTGDSVSRALMQQGIEFNSISDIIISHHHSDHLAGLPSLITQMKMSNRNTSLKIHSHFALTKLLKKFLEISYIFIEDLPFRTEIINFDYTRRVIFKDDLSFSAQQNSHVVNKHKISNKNINFISSSFLFEHKKKRIIYTSDVGRFEDLYLFDIKNSDIVITDATHISLNGMQEFIYKSSPKIVYFTHFDDENIIRTWIEKLPSKMKVKIFMAYDGLTVRI